MPRPLLLLFVAAALVAVAAVIVVLVRPPSFGTVAIQERRPPPNGTYTHDAGRIVSAPLPSVVPTVAAPCGAVRGVRLIGGGDAVARLNAAIEQACRLERGVSADVTAAVDALVHATVRFGAFTRTGVESTLDTANGTLWLNVKFAVRKIPVAHLVPVLLHDGMHLARRAEAVTAQEELRARGVEVSVCRQLIDVRRWPRWCKDARSLTDLPRDRAIALLIRAGYRGATVE